MADIQSINTQPSTQSLYFAATQAASQQQARQAQKTEKKEKSAFATAFEKRREEESLVSEGLPVELAGMSEDEAVVFLKDAMDLAGDELKAKQDLASMEKYRRKVSQFMKYIVKINYNFITTREQKRLRNGRVFNPLYQVQVIDQKLNQLASEMLILHGANLKLLAKVEEIQGLIIDLMAE